MRAGSLVREARRRGGLTQTQLARRLRTTQSAIARIETGAAEPSFERVAAAVEACGLELQVGLRESESSDWSVAAGNLQLDIDQRVRQHQAAVRFIRAGREAVSHAGR